MIRFLRRTTLTTLLMAAMLPAAVSAEVSRVEITARRDFAGGRAFGTAGPYEQLTGKLYLLIDPANKRNTVVADLDKAPRNAAGKIELSTDLVIVKPRDPSKGNGIALFDIVNRGNTVVFPAFNGPATDTPEGEAGDGFVLSRGYTIVRVGWEFDVRREGAVRIDVPAAVGVTGLVSATFIPNSRAEATVGDLVGYTPSDPASPQNTLKVRTVLGGEFVMVPRAKWQLKGNTVTLEGGFEPGQTYELSYLAVNPPVAGLGFAAVRDAATWVKYAPDATVSAKYTFAFGQSQTGRWLRDFVYEGFNTDERNRKAFDGVMPHIGGAGGIDLDRRWSTPTSLSMESVTRYPFSDRKQRDPVTGLEEGLLENPRASENQPKIFYTNSSTEYWQRGVALAHMTPDATKDVAPPDNVRMYNFSSASHNIGRFPPGVSNGQQAENPFDYRLTLRALLVAMEKWVRDGVAPPASRYPRLQDGTLVKAAAVEWPNIPGVTSPRTSIGGTRGANRLLAREGGGGTPLPYLVPQVDRDGNELGGLRLPEVSVPLATYTGWNFRNQKIGGTEQQFALMGGYVPFASTKAEREQKRDPRLSIEERYKTREHYLELVRDAAAPVVKSGYLLADDVATVVKRAGDHWDFLAKRPAVTTTSAER
jgi:hypothetical protein